MRIASSEQAQLINKLTYKLFKLQGSQNVHTIIAYQDALKFTWEIAETMIADYKSKIKSEEIEVYLRPKMYATDKLVEITPIQFIENYKVIVKYNIDLDSKVAEIHTNEGSFIKIEGEDNLREHNFKLDMRGMANILKKSVDADNKINIYQVGVHKIVFAENAQRDIMYRNKVCLFNKMLAATNGILPCNYKGEHDIETIGKILPLVRYKDMDTYNELYEIDTSISKVKDFLSLITDAKNHAYGLALKNEEVILL